MRRSRALAAVLGLTLAVQACSSATTPAPASVAATPAASVAAPSSGAPTASAAPVTVTLLEMQAPRRAVMEKILPMCEASLAAAGKNIKI